MPTLYIVPTPIGNLEDITLRALRILKEVDFVLAEDTRTSKKLLDHYEIKQQLVAHHIHNEHKTLEHIVQKIKHSTGVALISDAGTPAISDPGFLLIRACYEAGIEVTCLPGPNAIVPALVGSGFPSDRFAFDGFLPHKKGRQTRWKELATEQYRSIVLYESPHRIVKCLTEVVECLGEERQVCVARELSKLHEEFVRGTAVEVLARFQDKKPLGEMVVVIAPPEKNK